MAYANRLRWLDPAYKTGFSLLSIAICLTVDHPAVSLLMILLNLSIAFLWAALPVRPLFRALTIQGSFLLIGVISVAVSISPVPQAIGVGFGGLWLTVTPASIRSAVGLLLRSFGCVSAMNLLALTTPMPDLINLSRRLHVPDLLIDLATLMYRFIFALLDSLERMTLAQEVRFGFSNWANTLRSAAQIGSNLFVETFRSMRRLEIALESRAWDGHFRVLSEEYQTLKWPWQS